MNRFNKTLVMCGALLGLASACKSSSNDSYKAADRVEKEQRDLTKEVSKKIDKAVDGVRDIAHEVNDVNAAQGNFEAKRLDRVRTLRGFHALDLANLESLKLFAQVEPLTDTGRAMVDEKTTIGQLRLEEAGRMIQEMPTTTAEDWKVKDQAMSDAMVRLYDVINEGFTALRDAPRLAKRAASL